MQRETVDSSTFTSAEYNAASFCVGLVELRSSYVCDCRNIHETTIEFIKYIARHQYFGACAKRLGQLYLLNMLQKHFYVGHVSEIYSAAMYESQLTQVTSHAANILPSRVNDCIARKNVNETAPYVQNSDWYDFIGLKHLHDNLKRYIIVSVRMKSNLTAMITITKTS